MNGERSRERREVPSGDAELVVAIAGGDLSGLGVLFDRHAEEVRRLFQRLGVSAFDLDDLVQETFLDVLRAAPRFDASLCVSAKAWLYGLAMMVARRHRRMVARMLARVERWARDFRAPSPPSPEACVLLSAEAERAGRALDTLSPKKREAFVLVTLEGMSGDEAAAALSVPVATVWTRLHHARLELRAVLDDASVAPPLRVRREDEGEAP